MRVAVLGTGIMGTGVAHSLERSGHDVVVWNRTPARAEPLADDGILIAATPAEAIAAAEVVLTALYDADAVYDVVSRIAPDWPDRTIWVQAATVGLAGARRLTDLANRDDIPTVEAMMLGTKAPAEQGKLRLLVAGDRQLEQTLRPVFEAIAAKVLWVGDEPGNGTALKLVCNAWIATITAATGQSVALADALGLDPSMFLEAIEGTPTDSAYAQTKGTAMIEHSYETQFAVDGVRKDVGLITDAADAADVDPTVIGAVLRMFESASARGHGSDDMAAVVEAFRPAPPVE
jgi:3-hydroxyisobutyrate dehydrogenase